MLPAGPVDVRAGRAVLGETEPSLARLIELRRQRIRLGNDVRSSHDESDRNHKKTLLCRTSLNFSR